MAEKLCWRSKLRGAELIESLFYPGQTLILFDTETTGLNPERDKIIQFSALRCRINNELNLQEIDTADFYINPCEPLNPKIIDITGITDDMVKQGHPMCKRFDFIKGYLESVNFWVGQNLEFDIKMLKSEASRLNKSIIIKPYIDILDMSRDWLRKGVDVENYKLGTVYETLFPDSTLKFHDSMEDVRATERIFHYFALKYLALPLEDEPDNDKLDLSVNRARVFINPHNPRQQRIQILLSEGDYGDIFYDVIDKQWACKTSTAAKNLFKVADMEDIEQQVLTKYHYSCMDDLAKSWMKYKRSQKKTKIKNVDK